MLVGEQLGCPEGAARFALAAVHAVRAPRRARRTRRAASGLALPSSIVARCGASGWAGRHARGSTRRRAAARRRGRRGRTRAARAGALALRDRTRPRRWTQRSARRARRARTARAAWTATATSARASAWRARGACGPTCSCTRWTPGATRRARPHALRAPARYVRPGAPPLQRGRGRRGAAGGCAMAGPLAGRAVRCA